MAQRLSRATAVTAGAALAASIVTALRRRPWGRAAGGAPPRGDGGPDAAGVREPRVPTPSGGAAAAAADPAED